MNSNEIQPSGVNQMTASLRYENEDEVISCKECKKYLKKYDLSDERILAIKDNMIGVIDSLINSYLEDFK